MAGFGLVRCLMPLERAFPWLGRVAFGSFPLGKSNEVTFHGIVFTICLYLSLIFVFMVVYLVKFKRYFKKRRVENHRESGW